MAGTVTATYDKGLNGNYTIQSAESNGFNFAVGTVALGTYTSGGMTFTLDFNNTDFVLVGPASGYMFQYDYENEALQIFNPTASVTVTGTAENETSPAQELASDTDVTSFTAVQFVAFGH
jgi:hypothetical protein|tara:strand:- start:6278 stop:6637 length:360 start_codon:yes stop_codon:yes gene_type:complete